MDDPNRPDRRDFLRLTLAATAAGALPGLAGAAGPIPDAPADARAFLDAYNVGWLPLETAANEAAWVALTDVSPAHTAEQVARAQPLNEFVGSPKVIETVRRLLEQRERLDDLTVRQLEKVRLRAAEAPGTVPEVVKDRIKAEADQSAAQDGYRLHSWQSPRQARRRTVSANAIDNASWSSRPTSLERQDVLGRLQGSSAAKLRPGLLKLREPPQPGRAGPRLRRRSSPSRSPTTG